jgi:hypothetical protein
MTNSEIVKGYVSYCICYVPRVHTARGEMPLAIFKLANVNIEQNSNGINYINFDLVDEYGVMFAANQNSFYERALNPYGFYNAGLNHVVVKGNISMKTGYIQLIDTFNGRWFYSGIPDSIRTFDQYVENLEERGLKEKPKGLLKIPAHMMTAV